MNNQNKEVRSLDYEDAEVRSVYESREINGYAILFNKESEDLGGFTELILPSAMDGVILRSDVFATLNHDRNRGILARSTNGKGSLKLTVDKRGVKYSFDAPKHNLGDELLEGVRRGDIRSSSFGFTVRQGGAKMERRSDGSRLRTITQFDAICDVSPVYNPAYIDASVAIRSLDEQIKLEEGLDIEVVATPVAANTAIEMLDKTENKISTSDLTKIIALRNKNNRYKKTI